MCTGTQFTHEFIPERTEDGQFLFAISAQEMEAELTRLNSELLRARKEPKKFPGGLM